MSTAVAGGRIATRATLAAALVGAALLAPATPAAAQEGVPDPRRIRPGQTITDTLRRTDPVLPDTSHYHLYWHYAQAGERLRIRLVSATFDVFLVVGTFPQPVESRTAGFQDQVHDDDGDGGTNARIDYTVPRTGWVAVRVNALFPRVTGGYSLSMERLAAMVPAPPPPPSGAHAGAVMLLSGQAMRRRFTAADVAGASDIVSHHYLYQGRAGEEAVVVVRALEFDAYVTVTRLAAPGEPEERWEDDDGGGGTDARVRIRFPRDGTYQITVRPLSRGEFGEYAVAVHRPSEADPTEVRFPGAEQPAPPAGRRPRE